MNRYQRQTLLPTIGDAGQARLAASRVLLVGCGALGTALAEHLVRAGVGHLTIADRDVVELSNLQRQVLFDERQAALGLPKAVAAAERLAAINSSITVDPRVTDVQADNLEELASGPVDLILDGTDNVATRYLVNDVAIKHGIPWIYGACVGTEGRCMAVLPGATACLRCLFPTPPDPATLGTCDTAGILGPAAAIVAALQATAAIKLLSGQPQAIVAEMQTFDVWSQRFRPLPLTDARDPACPCCGQRRFEYLAAATDSTVSLCGRNAVQIRPPASVPPLDLVAFQDRLAKVGQVERSRYLLRCQLREPAGIGLTLFPDGRLIVHGLQDAGRAKSLYARYVGS